MGIKAEDDQPKHEALKVINQALSDRTTLGGTRITEADKLMFGLLFKTYTSLTYAEKEFYIHLSRWFSYLQTINEFIGNREKIVFSRNRLYKF
jgi:glutathione S-transferase